MLGLRSIGHDADDLTARGARDAIGGALGLAIAGGTTEIQKNGLAEGVLGLPREPKWT